MSEAAFQTHVMAIARTLRYRFYHTHDSRRSPAGFPDLVMVRPRRLVFAELKRERGRVSQEQTQWIFELQGAGAEVYLWRPSDLLSGKILGTLK